MRKFLVIVLSALTLLFTACETWMQDDGFYSDIEHDVKVANATQIHAYVRFAMTRQGSTVPEGNTSFKVEIPQTITATTEPEYGFVRWAAFSTSFLATGNNQGLNKDVYFKDDDDYNTRLRPHEITSPTVVFSNPRSPTTSVTINSSRNDIFIVPLVAQRPSVGLTLPGAGEQRVVKNTAVRINFTKPMNPNSFKNSEGEWDKIIISQGTMTNDENGDIDIENLDITDYFLAPAFSSSKKTVTMKFNDEHLAEGFPANAKIFVKISKDVTDLYGFSMLDDEKVNFTVGTDIDNLAPRITQLTGGMLGALVLNSAGTALERKTNFNEIKGMYRVKNLPGTIEGATIKITDTNGSDDIFDSAATKGLDDTAWTSYIAHRTGNKFILHVEAVDVSSATSSQNLELDVASISMHARPVFEATGNGSQSSYGYGQSKANGYAPQLNSTSLQGTFKSLAGNSATGTLVEYDLSDAPDGLLQIDVWAFDTIGNSGYDTIVNSADPNYDTDFPKHGNSWASLFVVKDSTPPKIKDGKNIIIKKGSETLEYTTDPFFNATSYATLSIPEDPNDNPNTTEDESENCVITDSNHYRLASKHDNLRWVFWPEVGSYSEPDSSWTEDLDPTAPEWKKVSDGYTGFTAPDDWEDGKISLVCALMDDVGNISDPIILRSINYDNTKPVINETKKLTLTADSASGLVNTVTRSNILDSHTLQIPIFEKTAGIRTIELSVTGGSNGDTPYAHPFGADSDFGEAHDVDVWIGNTSVSTSDFKIDGTKLIFNDRDALRTSYLTNATSDITIKIKKIKISDIDDSTDPDLEGLYTIKAKVIDSAGNDTTEENETATKTEISVDSTAPVINRINIPDINKTYRYTDTSHAAEYWIDYNSTNLNKSYSTPRLNSIYITYTETNSGAKIFDFYGSNMSLTSDSKFYKVHEDATSGYVRDSSTPLAGTLTTSSNKWTASNPQDLKSDSPIIIEVTNVQLYSSSAAYESNIKLTITDEATNVSTEKNIIESGSNTAIPGFKYDSSTPSSPSITLSDLETESDCIAAVAHYTNSSSARADVYVYSTYSGIIELTLTGDAEFSSSTIITDITSTPNIPIVFDIVPSSNNKTIRFKEEITTGNYSNSVVGASQSTAYRLLRIDNLKLVRSSGTAAGTSPDGDYDNIQIMSKNFANRTSSYSTKTTNSKIRLDTEKPEWNNMGLYTYYSSNSPTSDCVAKVFPHPIYGGKAWGIPKKNASDEIQKNTDNNPILYFYEGAGNIWIKPDAGDTNLRSDYFRFEYIESATSESCSGSRYDSYFYTGFNGHYKAYATDYAGNKSTIIDFWIIPVSELRSGIDNLENHPNTELILPALTQTEIDNGLTVSKDANTHINTYKSTTDYKSSAYEFSGNSSSSINTYNYVLKKYTDNWKLKVKVHDYVKGDNTYAPVEKYGIVHRFNAYGSGDYPNHPFVPVEPSTWHNYQDAEGHLAKATLDSQGKPVSGINTSSQDKPNITSYVHPDGDIIIMIPNQNCPPLALWLMDGCGNKKYVLLNPDLKEKLGGTLSTYGVISDPNHGKRTDVIGWIIDNEVGSIVRNSSGGIIRSYNDVNSASFYYTSNAYMNKPGDVTFYKKYNNTGDTNQIQIGGSYGLSDTCRFDISSSINITSSTTETTPPSEYSMRSRLMAWALTSTTGPTQADFNSATDRASAWCYYKEKKSDEPIWLSNYLPEYNSVDSNGYGVPYKLYYIVEDRVGNFEIKQLKNGDTQLWLYDNTKPTLNISALTNDNKVNLVDNKFYYSDQSSANYTIEDPLSGIMNRGGGASNNTYPTGTYPTAGFKNRETNFPPSGTTIGYSLYGKSPDSNNHISITGVTDWALNTADGKGLEIKVGSDVIDTWVKQTTYPAHNALTHVTAIDKTTGHNNATIDDNDTTDAYKYIIKATRKMTSIDVQLKVSASEEELLGWYIWTKPATSTTTAPTFKTFYSESEVEKLTYNPTLKTYTKNFTFTKSEEKQSWHDEYEDLMYFYPVNRAGLINQTPIIVGFFDNKVPTTYGSLSFSEDIKKYPTSGSVTDLYTKSTSTLTFQTKNHPLYCRILYGDSEDGSGDDGVLRTTDDDCEIFTLADYIISGGTTDNPKYKIPLAGASDSSALRSISGASLRLILDTGIEDCDPINIKMSLCPNKWTFDETAPVISIESIQSTTSEGNEDAVTANGVDYLLGSNAIIEFSSTATDIAEWQWNKGNGSDTFEKLTLTSGKLTLSGTNVPTSAKTYKFKAVDKAGNVSDVITKTLRQDTAAPTGNLSFNLQFHNDSTNTTSDATSGFANEQNGSDTTSRIITYDPTKVNQIKFNFSAISDASSGIKLYKITPESGTATEISGTDTSCVLSLANNLNASVYTVTVEDFAGHIRTLGTFNFNADSSDPNFTLSDVKTNATTPAYHDTNTDIYYVNGTSAIINFATTTSGDIAGYEWDQGTGTYTSLSITGLSHTISSLPSTAVDKDHKATYNFRAVDKVGHKSSPVTVYLVKDTVAPVVNDSTPVTVTPSGTENVNYIASEASGTITLTYNPASVDKLEFNFSGVSDAASGIQKFVYRTGTGDSTVDTTILSNELSLIDASNAALTGTYRIIAIDNVGNEKLLKTIVLKTNKPAPASQTTCPYKGADEPHVTNSAYTASFTPKTNNAPSPLSGTTIYIPTSATFQISLDTNTVIDNQMDYFVKYIAYAGDNNTLPALTSTEPSSTEWTTKTLTSGKLEVTVDGSQLTGAVNYIFIWLRDKIGNKAVYGLAYSTYGWWTVDTAGPTSSSFGLTFKKNNATVDNMYKSDSDDNTTVTFNGNQIDTVSISGTSNLTDSGAGVSDNNKNFWYRAEGGVGTKVSNKAISVSALTEGTTYEIYAKDDFGNETVFKKIIMDKTGPAANIAEPAFYKDGDVLSTSGYTVTESGDTLELKYNTGLKKFKAATSTSEEGVTYKKWVNNSDNGAYDGTIGLSLGNGANVTIIIKAYDKLYNETTVIKYKFIADDSQTISANINTIGGAGFAGHGTKTHTIVNTSGKKNSSATAQDSNSRIVQFFNNVQNTISGNKEYEETSYNPAVSEMSVNETAKPARKSPKKKAKKVADKPAVTIAEPVTEIAQPVEVTVPQTTPQVTEIVAEPAVEAPAAIISEEPVEQSSSKTPVIVVMLAILASCGGAWFTLSRRKK